MKTIVLTGGGTAGHVYPALAVAEKMKEWNIHYIGTCGIEKQILSNFPNIIFHEIPATKFERKFTFKNLAIPFKLAKSIFCAKKELKVIKPNVVFSKGGFVAVPVAIAAKSLGIPLVSHESDLSLGLANKIILHFCKVMCTAFKKTAEKHKKCIYTGQPIRAKIFHGHKLRFENFDRNLPTLLVLGGSLGARFLNELIFQNLPSLTQKFNILHICGKNNYQKIVYQNYQIFPYANNIEDFYATADFALCRAGSGVINELFSLEIPMLLVPLSKNCSRGDQIENAKLFESLGYAKMLEEEDCTYINLIKNLENISKNSQKIKKNMQKSSKINSATAIFEILAKNAK